MLSNEGKKKHAISANGTTPKNKQLRPKVVVNDWAKFGVWCVNNCAGLQGAAHVALECCQPK